MKNRTFFLTLILFLLFFNASTLLMSLVTWNDRLTTQKERCLQEHYFIASALRQDLQNVEERGNDPEELLGSLMQPYLRSTQNGRTDLALLKKGDVLYATADFSKAPAPATGEEDRVVTLERGEHLFLYVSGALPSPYGEWSLTYRYNLDEILASWQQLKNLLFFSGAVFSSLLAFCLLLLLGRIFRPLQQISEASRQISEGDYAGRLPVRGRDEIADMSQNFNNMAAEIECQVCQLKEAAEQKQQFIDNFAHELRTPLTAVYGYAEYLQRANISGEDRVSATAYIMQECKRIQSMSEQLLQLALLRNSAPQWEEVQVNALFDAVIETISPKAAAKEIIIEKSVAADFPDTLRGSGELFNSLLLNLLDNAVKASGRGGRVWLEACLEESIPVFLVRDEGHGMTAEQLLHVKEAFYRADKARSRRDGGAGLGLALCDQIAAVHGAVLSIASEPEKGTEAKVSFTA